MQDAQDAQREKPNDKLSKERLEMQCNHRSKRTGNEMTQKRMMAGKKVPKQTPR